MISLLLSSAQAFCGFYVGSAGQDLYSDATMVVMMREGTKTVLSMQNSYSGPPEDFAMVVPVPTVLRKWDVKTLPRELFTKIDTLAAPRLVEYFEKNPCAPKRYPDQMTALLSGRPGREVEVEAEFAVGEYDVVILSADDSAGLETWLKNGDYAIPEGAESVLRGYVEQGSKFFVAKVAPDRVTFEEGRAVLSPLRIAYDSETFQLPIRLGMLNAKGEQDLIVHILADDRYEVANLPNVTIPTNLVVQDAVRRDFGAFYEAVFSLARADEPDAVVTEYAWSSSKCDPCPGPTLNNRDLATLGNDVIRGSGARTLTRLHHRYSAGSGGEDLVFRKARPISGGRGMPDAKGQLNLGVTHHPGTNTFQGRYAILHPYNQLIACYRPRRGQWSAKSNTRAAPSRLQAGTTGAAPELSAFLVPKRPERALCGVAPEAGWPFLFLLPLLRRRSHSGIAKG